MYACSMVFPYYFVFLNGHVCLFVFEGGRHRWYAGTVVGLNKLGLDALTEIFTPNVKGDLKCIIGLVFQN